MFYQNSNLTQLERRLQITEINGHNVID